MNTSRKMPHGIQKALAHVNAIISHFDAVVMDLANGPARDAFREAVELRALLLEMQEKCGNTSSWKLSR